MIRALTDIKDDTREGKMVKAAIAYIILNHELTTGPDKLIERLNEMGEQIYGKETYYGTDT